MPELGLVEPARAIAWHVRQGQEVIAGDRLLEVCAGPISIDLPAPTSGRLTQINTEEDSPVLPGQILGMIVSRE